MRLNSDWRKYANSTTKDGATFWFHPSIPAQASYIGDFLESQAGMDSEGNMAWRVYLFYLLHGFLIDFEDSSDSMLSAYISDVVGLSLEDAYTAHMSHPLLCQAMYDTIKEAYEQTRDKSLQEISQPLDITIDANEEKVEKKEVA